MTGFEGKHKSASCQGRNLRRSSVSCPPGTSVASVRLASRDRWDGWSTIILFSISYIKNISSIKGANKSRTTPCDHVYGYFIHVRPDP